MSLKNKYQDRGIRVGQFIVLWAVLALLLGAAWWVWLATQDQQIYTLARAWHALGFDAHLIAHQGQLFPTGWVVETITARPAIVGWWGWWMAAIPLFALALDVGIFWLMGRVGRGEDDEADHLRGARVVDAQTLTRITKK